MGFGSKTRKFGNRFLKTLSKGGTLARKTGHVMEDVGKVVATFGAVSGQPEIAGIGAGMIIGGDAAQEAGIIARKGAIGAWRGDATKLKSAGKKMFKVLR